MILRPWGDLLNISSFHFPSFLYPHKTKSSMSVYHSLGKNGDTHVLDVLDTQEVLYFI